MPPDDETELDDELRSFVEERLGHPFTDETPTEPDEPEGPEPDEEVEPVEVPDEPPDEVPEPTEQPSEEDAFQVAPGVSLPKDVALSYAQFDALLRNDPELFRLINETVQGRRAGAPSATQPTAPPAPSLPEITIDEYTDPNLRALYETARAQQQYITDLNARLQQVSDVTITREREEFQSLLQTTRENFSRQHSLTRAQMDQVQATAERLNVVPSLMRGVDPITGTVAPRDRASALSRAFDIAFNYIPEFREKALAEAVQARAKSSRRKQKLAGVSGSGGGMPKSEPVPSNERERRLAMIKEVAEAMGEHRPE